MVSEWREPSRYERAGFGRWKRPPAPYDTFMEAEGIPTSTVESGYLSGGEGLHVRLAPRGRDAALGETGQADRVPRQDYEPVGMVSAASMGGQWFHQHFGISRGPLRLMAWFGPFGRGTGREPGRPGEEVLDKNALHLDVGGSAIPYWDEDPYIRQEWEAALRAEGASSRMEEAFYR